MRPSELLTTIEEEVRASYFLKDVQRMTFENFFDEVNTQYAYEEEWNPDYYKPFYFVIFNKIKKGELK